MNVIDCNFHDVFDLSKSGRRSDRLPDDVSMIMVV